MTTIGRYQASLSDISAGKQDIELNFEGSKLNSYINSFRWRAF